MKSNSRLRIRLVLFAITVTLLPLAHGQGGYDTPKKTDTFDAGPGGKTRTAASRKPRPEARAFLRGPRADLRRGQIVQVLQSSRFARPEMAFYLPPEATSVVQLVVEKRGSDMNYFLKALSSGNTVGGAVERAWLDGRGFRPRSLPDEARIQAAVRRNPLFIKVR